MNIILKVSRWHTVRRDWPEMGESFAFPDIELLYNTKIIVNYISIFGCIYNSLYPLKYICKLYVNSYNVYIEMTMSV